MSSDSDQELLATYRGRLEIANQEMERVESELRSAQEELKRHPEQPMDTEAVEAKKACLQMVKKFEAELETIRVKKLVLHHAVRGLENPLAMYDPRHWLNLGDALNGIRRNWLS
ncbi:hypothetical protein L5515_006268 [Caenorhabditis briggsae]|uniref:Uncharacterized protein n=1 Tax=Caenorhabditis briggsae TaxID=6238 RepID=A0AAE8ZZS8_CAEBR|nr:hypothetical protein L3Y34_006459 [Caenorhabditis briggsae]UMM32503.1 hypothetical protein L5515_006268 [Caenorhabditis briggsae]